MKQPRDRRTAIRIFYMEEGPSFDASYPGKAAIDRNVGRFGGPRRDCAEARYHEERRRAARRRGWLAVLEQPLQDAALRRLEGALAFGEMAELGGDGAYAGIGFLQCGEELGEAELRQRARAAELQDLGH